MDSRLLHMHSVISSLTCCCIHKVRVVSPHPTPTVFRLVKLNSHKKLKDKMYFVSQLDIQQWSQSCGLYESWPYVLRAALTDRGADSCDSSLRPSSLMACTRNTYVSPVLRPWTTNLKHKQNCLGLNPKRLPNRGGKYVFMCLFFTWVFVSPNTFPNTTFL